MRLLKPVALVVLGAIALLTLIIGVAAPLYKERFDEKRERFLRDGHPVTQTVVAKGIARKGRYIVVGRPDDPPDEITGKPRGKSIRVNPATYERFQVGDQVDLLVIGEEYFVRDAEFYTVLDPLHATILFGITGVLFVLIMRRQPRSFAA